MTEQRFPFPHEVATPEGAEGWQSMYPYYLTSSDTTEQRDRDHFWFADTMHYAKVQFPFDSIVVEAAWLGLSQYASRIFSFPFSLGMDVRIVNGYTYTTSIPVTDPEEIERRAALFQERTQHYYQNWDDLYDNWKTKIQAVIDEMKSLEFPLLGQFDVEEVVTEARGRSSGYDLVTNYRRLVDLFMLVHQYHFEMLNIGYAAYGIFFQFCKEAFPELDEQDVSRMVAGFEVIAFRPDDELRKLARLAVELDIDQLLISDSPGEEILEQVAKAPGGDRWVKAFEDAKDPWFNYSMGSGFYHDDKIWINDITVPIQNIVRYAGTLRKGGSIDRSLEQLHKDRDEIASAYRALLDDEQAKEFDDLLNLSRLVFQYLEEHTFFIEHWSQTLLWNQMRNVGQACVHLDLIDDAEDIFYLNRFEVDQALFDAVHAWAIGIPARAGSKHRDVIKNRKTIVDALSKESPIPALGVPPEEVTDPIMTMLWGITSQQVELWLRASDGDADGTINGFAGSPGVVEGNARLVRDVEDLARVEQGDIIVCAITSPSWVSAFQIAGGVVSDSGGMMSHAAIVCREYGIPAVVGTGIATQQIEDGQRLRLDGSGGVVTFLPAS
jgi:pyruvate,water dikinase